MIDRNSPPWKPYAKLRVPLETLTRVINCPSPGREFSGVSFLTSPTSTARTYEECQAEVDAGTAARNGFWYQCADCGRIKYDCASSSVHRGGEWRAQCPYCRQIALHEEQRTKALERQVKAAQKQSSLFKTTKAGAK